MIISTWKQIEKSEKTQ